MPVVKVGGGLSGGNSGSSGNAVAYLEKENRVRKKSERSTETFFNQRSLDISPTFAIKHLDSKRQGIKKHEAKFYNLIISPSQKELAELSNDDLKDYTKELMVKYAENFNRDIDPNDLVWFAKLEKNRKYKGFKGKKNDKLNLPPGVKSGDYKTGDNRHIHVLVRRKTEKNKSLSPLANQRKGTTKGAAVGKVGFNRIKFSAAAEALMFNHIIKKDPDFRLDLVDFHAHQFLKKNDNDYERAVALGFNPKTLNYISNKEENKKAEQIRKELLLELREKFNQVMNTDPKNLTEYHSSFGDLEVILKPIRNEDGKPIDHTLCYKGQIFKPSEIDNKAIHQNLVKMMRDKYLLSVEKNKEAEQPITSAEKVRIAINFHHKESYDGKLPNPSPYYHDSALVKAIESKHGFKISKQEFHETLREIEPPNRRKGLSR